MGYFDNLYSAANQSSDAKVKNKTETDSISPIDVGSAIGDSISASQIATNQLAAASIVTGTTPPLPATGNDLDYFFQGGTSIVIYKKVEGTWITLGNIPLGITITNANLSVQSAIVSNGAVARSYAGQWAIDNVIYTAATQTEFTIPTQHATLDRIDAIVGNKSNTLEYVTGTAMVSPVTPPALPSNTVLITYIYIPSIASGLKPYISDEDGQGQSGGSVSFVDIFGDPRLNPQLAAWMATKADLLDGLISGGDIDISDFDNGNIFVDAATWLLTIGGVQQAYSTGSSTAFTSIDYSDTGKQRYIAFFGTDVNTIIKVEGAESEAAVMPSTPADTVLLGSVLVKDSSLDTPIVDLSGYAKIDGSNIVNPWTFKQALYIDGVIDTEKVLWFTTDGKNRWAIGSSSDVESIDNEGSNLIIYRYNDDGSYLSDVLLIDRLTGTVDFRGDNPPTYNGVPIGGGDVQSVNEVEPDGSGNIELTTDDIPEGDNKFINSDTLSANHILSLNGLKEPETVLQKIPALITNTTTINRLTIRTNWSAANVYTGTAIENEEQCKFYKDGNYWYFMYDSTTPLRIPINSLEHLIGNSSTPTIVAGAGAGTSPTISISGTDLGFRIALTTGTAPSTGTIATVTFNRPYGSAPFVAIGERNANSAGLAVRPYATTSTTALTLSIGTALSASTQYIWEFILAQ